MSTLEVVLAGNVSPLKKLEQALQKAAVGGTKKKEVDFAEAYPVIEQHLGRKVPLKVVLENFGTAYGYVVHAPRFRKMLHAERVRRGEGGEVLTCDWCGQTLIAAVLASDNVADAEEHNHGE